MSPEAEPSLPVNALASTASVTAGTLVVATPPAHAVDDLGPAVCPTCGSLLIDALDPLRAVSGVLLSLLASLLALVCLVCVVAGLLNADGPGLFLFGLGAGAMAIVAGYSSHRVARRPVRHQATCRICGEREGRWTSTSSDSYGVFATLFSGPLLLPGLSLLAAALATLGSVALRTTLGMLAVSVGLVGLTFLIVRRPWSSSRGTDWASGSTIGRLFVGGQGVGTNPEPRAHVPSEGTARALLSAEEAAAADQLIALVRRGVLSLESRDDIVWSRFLSYHRLTLLPAELHATLQTEAAFGIDENDLAEAIVRELRAQARTNVGADAHEYRDGDEALLEILAGTRVSLPLADLLRRAGLPTSSARAVEGALRASIKPQRLGSRAYAALRAREPRALHKLPR